MKLLTVLIFGLVGNTQAALASDAHKINQAFQVQGQITNFYGKEKSAEAVMWKEALQVCQNLEGKARIGLLLNRLSDVELGTEESVSTATASFVCVPVGAGE